MYQPFNPAVPEGADTPPVYADTDLANIRALRDGIVSGFVPGWALAYAALTGPVRDQYTWSNGIYRLRATFAYTAGLIASLLWEWSENSGGAYVTINTGGSAAAIVSSADGSIASVSNDAAAFILGVAAGQRAALSKGSLDGHTTGVGSAVHGLGTMSTQNANAVAITGGSASAMALLLAPRITHAVPPTLTTATAFDWAARPSQVKIAAGATISGFTNAADGEMKRVIVIGNGAITINAGAGNTLTWGTGHPVWGANYTIVNLIAVSTTAFLATAIPF